MSKEAPKQSKNDFPDDELGILDEKFPDLQIKQETNEKVDKDVAAMHHRVRVSREGIFAQRKREAEVAITDKTEDAPKNDLPNGLQRFTEIVQENAITERIFISLAMVSDLLKNSYNPNAVDISVMGFSQENLHNLMRAVFGAIKGKSVTDLEIIAYFDQYNHKSTSIIYENLMGLNENSDESEIRTKLLELEKIVNRLQQLLCYKSTRFVFSALLECEEKDDIEYEEDEEPETNEAIIKRFGFDGAPIRFDEAEIKKMLQEVETAEKRKKDEEPDEIQMHALQFLAEKPNEPALKILETLQQMFAISPDEYRASHQSKFNGETLAQVAAKLDARFSDIPGFSRELRMAGEQDENVNAILGLIIESHDAEDPEALQVILNKMRQTIGRLYPDLLEADDPTRSKMDDELMTFYEKFWKSPETKSYFFPLYHLYYALRWEEERYDTEYRTQYFGNQTRQQVMRTIDANLGAGTSARIQQVSRGCGNYRTALIRFIALAQGHTEYDDTLKDDIVAVSDILGNLYPPIRTK